MGMLILVAIIAVVIYIYSFNNRDKNLDYKLTPEYQKSGYDDKLRTDIIKGLEIKIKNEVINNYSNKDFRIKAIENVIEARESYLYLNIEPLSQQHKISHNATFDAIFDACNYIRVQFGIPAQALPNNTNKIQEKSTDLIKLSQKQKLSFNIFLGYIIHSCYSTNPYLHKLYKAVERKQLNDLGLSMSETIHYLELVNTDLYSRNLYMEIMKSLNDKEKDLLVSMALDLLTCNGMPSEEEYIKFEKAFDKVVGIDKDDFSNRLIKINAILDKFSK